MGSFKKITIDDKEMISKYLKQSQYKACDYSVANIILWSSVYGTEYAIIEDMLIMKYRNNEIDFFTFPMGESNHKAALEWMIKYCEEQEILFQMNPVEPQMYQLLEQILPGKFSIKYNRDGYDYVYNREDLQNLVGKKYHGKKNHINKFIKMNPEWTYEDITNENLDECIEMVKKWCIVNNCCEDKDKAAEICVVLKALENIEVLNLKGGIIRTKEEIVALTMGEEMKDGMFVIHFEKAFATVQGAYPMINQQFIQHQLTEYQYINREEDLGIEGLRKAKESYCPEFLVEKGTVVIVK